jgi:NitT/TauT family transport system substrate-binding protein
VANTILRIGHLSTFYHTAIVLMGRAETEKRISCRVCWRLFGTGPAIVKALEQGELDLAYIGLPPAIIGIGRGVPIVCVAGGHMEGTVISGRREAISFSDDTPLDMVLGQFTGRKIGVPGNGSIHDVILRELLDRLGRADSVGVANYPWADQAAEAFVRREVEAVIGTPALAVAVRHYAGGRILCPPSFLWPHNPSYGIIVRRDFLQEHPGRVKSFLLLHEEAEELLRTSPALAADLISGVVGVVDTAFVSETLAVSPRYCSQLTEEFVASSMEFAAILRRLGYTDRAVGPEEIFERSLIDEVHPGPAHYYSPS